MILRYTAQLATNDACFKRVDRDDALRATYAGMAKRLTLRAEAPMHSENRLKNPLVGTLTTTGGGKSFFLDELGALHPGDLHKLCENEELRNILEDSIAVPVTFNGASPLGEIDTKIIPSGSVALRALYR